MRALTRTLRLLTLPGAVALGVYHGHVWSLTNLVGDLLLFLVLGAVALGYGPLLSQRLIAGQLADMQSAHRDDIEQLRDEFIDAVTLAREEGLREGVMRERLHTDRSHSRPNLSVAK